LRRVCLIEDEEAIPTDLFRREKCSFSSRSRGHPPNRFDTTVGRAHNAVKFGQGISLFFAAFGITFSRETAAARGLELS
jgi:hypothetical protein